MREKNYNLELIRTISFISVVVIHVSNYFCRAFGSVSAGEYVVSLVLDTFARVSVPCFFMLSGALLLGRTETVQKCWQRAVHFLAPLVVWSIIYYLFNRYYMGTEFDLKKIMWVPSEAHLWYLYAMIPLYMVLPFFQVMVQGMSDKMDHALLLLGTVAIVINYTLSLFDGAMYYDVPLFGDRAYAYYFFLGYYLVKYKDKIRISNRKLWSVFIASNIVTICVTACVSVKFSNHWERALEYGCPLVVLSSILFFIGMLRLENGKIELGECTKKWIDEWCSCSFGIYLVHILFLDCFKKHVEAAEVSAYWAIPTLVLGILLLSYGSVKVIRLLPGGKKIT